MKGLERPTGVTLEDGEPDELSGVPLLVWLGVLRGWRSRVGPGGFPVERAAGLQAAWFPPSASVVN